MEEVANSPTTGVGKFIKGMGGPGAVLGLGASLIGGFLGAGQARRARREAQREAKSCLLYTSPSPRDRG